MSGSSAANGRDESEGLGPLVDRVKIRNYKSIASCDVALGPLTVLVGRNSSGKSNFLDALSFVADALREPLDQALRARLAFRDAGVRGRLLSEPISIELELILPGTRRATYGIEVGIMFPRGLGGLEIREEYLEVASSERGELVSYHVRSGTRIHSSVDPMPPVPGDRLYLTNAAGLSDFREVYDALRAMVFYNFNPEAMRALQPPDAGRVLHRDGRNIASVVARLASERPEAMERVRSYLATIVPGVLDVERETLGPSETLVFHLRGEGASEPKKFYAFSMSDGTLRALGALVAVNQLADAGSPVRLVGIEEPETALHPAASGVLMDALREAASHTQVLVTTHSPDLLDQIDLETDHLLAVQASQGETQIGPVDPASRRALQDHLYTAGELLRMDQLEPDRTDLLRQERTPLSRGAGEP